MLLQYAVTTVQIRRPEEELLELLLEELLLELDGAPDELEEEPPEEELLEEVEQVGGIPPVHSSTVP